VLPILASGARGAAFGTLAITLLAAGLAAQNFHLFGPIGDGGLGILLVGGPMILLAAAVRAIAWLGHRLWRARQGSARPRARAVALTRVIGHPLTVTSTFIAAVLVLGRDTGPLAVFSALIPFEILIGTGALAGLLLGLGVGLRSSSAASGVQRWAVVASLVLSVVIGSMATAWAAFPGFGSPIVREDTVAARAVIPQLGLPDPSARGTHDVMSATYGSGTDARRPEYGTDVTWVTPTVDASRALTYPAGVPSLYADALWGFDTSRLPLNGLVWYADDATEPMPVALIVHGNHAAGEYSDPGYAYLAEHLASHGMFAVSVDENFLNGNAFHDFGGGEMGVRAWLLLRHLDQLRSWNVDPSHALAGRLDLDRVALIGHSRGGEAAALAAAVEAGDIKIASLPAAPDGFGIRAVVALAPSDAMYRGSGSPVTLTDVDYLVIQGAHDGDLPWFEGLRTYHRVKLTGAGDHLKVAAYSQRANHGRFNSVWDTGDAGPLASWMLDRGSLLSADQQEDLAKALVGAFLARSLEGRIAYDAFLEEPRAGMAWLPDDVVLTHWESSARVEPAPLGEGHPEDQGIASAGFTAILRQDPQLRDGSFQGDRALHLEWDGDATLTIPVERTIASRIDPDGQLVISLASVDGTSFPSPDLALTTSDGRAAVVSMADAAPLRPALPTRLWKLDQLGERYAPTEVIRWPAERFAQTYAIDLAAFTAGEQSLDLASIVSVQVRFRGDGAAFVDDVAFEGP
jgi:hypothetical protein